MSTIVAWRLIEMNIAMSRHADSVLRIVMILSAREFLDLLESADQAIARRAINEPAAESVWLDVIENHPENRIWVAQNKTLPESILAILSKDENENVRWWVAQTRRTSPEIKAQLANDLSPSVRHRIVMNRKTPLAILERLTQDEDPTVAESARERIRDYESK